MRVTNVSDSSSETHDGRVAVMSWRRRRIRRARRRSREYAPRSGGAITRASNAGRPSIRRLVVFVPLATHPPRAIGAVTPSARPVPVPGPA
jgi:hypothetical protein